jgi:Pectate lyase superfamily protein
VASKLTSRFVGQARRLPFFLVAAASVSFALQLQSAYAQNAREQVTLDTETHAVQNSVTDPPNVTLTTGGLTVNDAVGVKTFNLETVSGSKLGASAVNKIGFWSVTPISRPSSTIDLRQALINEGLYATGGATPLNLNGGTLTSGAFSGTTGSFSGNTTVGGNLTTTGAITGPIIDKGGQVFNVKAYGAVGDGVRDDTAAFNSALTALTTAGGGVCLVPKGTYIISASGITSKVTSGVHLAGVGRGASILKIAGMPTGNLLVCNGDNWSVQNLTLDLQDYYPARNLTAISCKGSNWRVANCSIIRQGRLGMSVGTGHKWSIEGNYISKTDDHNAGVQSILTSGASTNARIIDNVCEGSGMNLTGISYSIIARNRCSGAKYGSNLATGVVGTDALHVIGNICTGGRGRDLSNVWVSGFELWAPNSVIANNTAYDNDGGGMAIGGQNCIVIGNHSFNNGAGIGSSGITARYLNSGPNNASGSIFIGNHCHDTRWPGSGMTQNYGYAEQPGGLKHLRHFGNNYNSNKIGPTHYNSIFGQPNVSEIQSFAMKNKVKSLADAEDTEDIDMSDRARRALREYLDRE